MDNLIISSLISHMHNRQSELCNENIKLVYILILVISIIFSNLLKTKLL